MSMVSTLADRLLTRLVRRGVATAGLDYWTCRDGRWLHCRTGVGCVDEGPC